MAAGITKRGEERRGKEKGWRMRGSPATWEACTHIHSRPDRVPIEAFSSKDEWS